VPFTWSAASGTYLDDAGNPVSDEQLRASLDSVIETQSNTMQRITETMIVGALLLASWQRQAMHLSKTAHVQAAALALGGLAQLSDEQRTWVEGVIATQFAYLAAFGEQLADGRQSLTGAVARARMYVEAARSTHREAVGRFMKSRDYEFERNQLGTADHCSGCLTETARGWVPIGTLSSIGSRNCLSRCRCWLVYR